MVAHHISHFLHADLLSGLDEEGHLVLPVVAHGEIQVLLGLLVADHTAAQDIERGPYPGLAASHAAEIYRSVCVAETELLVCTLEVTHLAGEVHHVLGIEPVLGVIEHDVVDTGLVGMGADVSVRYAGCGPYDTLVDVAALLVELAALADELHDPHLVLVGDGE